MKVIVVSENNLKKIFQNIEKSDLFMVQYITPKEFKGYLSNRTEDLLFYLDSESFSQKKILALLEKERNIHLGIVDQKQNIVDSAILFRAGMYDYLGQKLCREIPSERRFNNLLSPIRDGSKQSKKNREINPPKPVIAVEKATSWHKVEPGNEYLFHMMYVELDGSRNLGYRIRETSVDRMLKNFQTIVEAFISTQKGKLWIWSDFGGIVLFPYVKDLTDIVANCMRLMLSRRIISVDQSEQKLLLSYRIVLYTGGTIYKERGKTGRIISDAVNSLAHIGQKYAHPGNMYIAKDIFKKCVPQIQDSFIEAGTFEGTELFKMRLPLKY